MAFDRGSALLWLPAAFVAEVAAWEIGSRLELAIVDPTWEEFGRTIGVERLAWGLAAAVVVLAAALRLLSRGGTAQVSLIQLVGILGLACYWIGASVLSSAAVVLVATLASWALSDRGEPA